MHTSTVLLRPPTLPGLNRTQPKSQRLIRLLPRRLKIVAEKCSPQRLRTASCFAWFPKDKSSVWGRDRAETIRKKVSTPPLAVERSLQSTPSDGERDWSPGTGRSASPGEDKVRTGSAARSGQ